MNLQNTSGRVWFEQGKVTLQPLTHRAEDDVLPIASIASIGTEMRQLRQTSSGPGRFAGYMNLVSTGNGERWLVPAPHGAVAYSATQNDRSLPVDPSLPLHYVAASRFQLIASVNSLPVSCLAGKIAVLGSGPVALGCVLELKRLRADSVFVVASHTAHVDALAPWVTIVHTPLPGDFDVVIDCTGDVATAIQLVRDGGLIGVLGTPQEHATCNALTIHRRGIHVWGMHELRPPAEIYVKRFEQITSWLSSSIGSEALMQVSSACPGECAPDFYARLGGARRFAPFMTFQW